MLLVGDEMNLLEATSPNLTDFGNAVIAFLIFGLLTEHALGTMVTSFSVSVCWVV